MKPYYDIAGLSKQAHQQYMSKLADKADRTAYYIGLMAEARSLHPVIGLAKIYHLYHPEGIGRTAFENLGKMAGYALEARPTLTWRGVRQIPYLNLLSDKQFTGINQIWVTDITYYKIGDTYYYISMIMDLYCRKIIACQASHSLQAKHSLKVLKAALKARQLGADHELIHHSDRGVQYTSRDYVNLLEKHHIQISMCNSVFENTHMERLNGIIKNDYLIHWNPKSFNHLERLLAKAAKNYNNCPHGQLGMMSPNQYEEQLKNVPLNQRTPMTVFTVKKSKALGDHSNQLQLFDSNLYLNQKGQPNLV
jgi:transposase InsO family protein